MVGHRTRLAQEDHRHWHDDEDQALDRYLKLSENVDQVGIQVNSIVTRGWMLVGLLGIAVPFISGAASPQAMAVSVGGILLASRALGRMVAGAQSLAGLAISWQQVGPIFKAAARPRELQSLDFVSFNTSDTTPEGQHEPTLQANSPAQPNPQVQPNRGLGGWEILPSVANNQPLLQAREIAFRYRPQGRPVIQDCSLQIQPGSRILLEGPSGGGKSTLAALLTGLRKPETGSMLLWGFDRQILGNEEWRRRIVMAPQFQENYVFSDTLGFNLLMGRHWPPQPGDLEEAELLLRELGLGEVFDRMPSGFQQMLGESGWQLSHGERSRLYIARTLLQKADMIILDESFGALDPENLSRSLQCVLNRAATVLVIAHP
jgi:ATP-binding cassette subfamily B protein